MKKIAIIVSIVLLTFVKSATAATFLNFTGQGYITQDQTYSYDDASCLVKASCINPADEDDLLFYFRTKDLEKLHWWYIAFSKANERLHVGMYEDVTRWHIGNYTQPSFDIFGDGRGSNIVSGWFEILEIEMNTDRSQVLKFAADFMHYSEGQESSWTSGSLRYNSDVPLTTIPEPGPVMVSSLSIILFLRRYRQKKKK